MDNDETFGKCLRAVALLDARERYAQREVGGYDRMTWVAGYLAAIDDAGEVIAQLRAGAQPDVHDAAVREGF